MMNMDVKPARPGTGVHIVTGQIAERPDFVLQGNKCNYGTTTCEQVDVNKVPGNLSKRVTFKPTDDEITGATDEKSECIKQHFRLTPQKETADERHVLEQNMQKFLQEVHRKREMQIKGDHSNDAEDNLVIQGKFEKAMSSRSSFKYGHSGSVRSVNTRSLYRTSPAVDLLKDKPVIKGLVVDSVSNQQPSIVRASKYANLREEIALRQRVEGFRFACNHNLTHLNFAQRRLSTSLVQLKSKMAAYGMHPKEETVGNLDIADGDALFLKNRGHLSVTSRTPQPLYFPPMTYPKRRLLTVN